MEKKDNVVLAITKRVAKILKMDDEGRIDKFYKREIKIAEKAIKDLKFNKDTLGREYQNTSEKDKESLEDAEIALKEAYEAVDPEKIKSYADCDSFAKTFWSNISRKKDILELLKVGMKSSKESYEKALKEIDEQIAKYQERIDSLSK